jgi:hypothetical protein
MTVDGAGMLEQMTTNRSMAMELLRQNIKASATTKLQKHDHQAVQVGKLQQTSGNKSCHLAQ